VDELVVELVVLGEVVLVDEYSVVLVETSELLETPLEVVESLKVAAVLESVEIDSLKVVEMLVVLSLFVEPLPGRQIKTSNWVVVASALPVL
jgi:hypothetical protein